MQQGHAVRRDGSPAPPHAARHPDLYRPRGDRRDRAGDLPADGRAYPQPEPGTPAAPDPARPRCRATGSRRDRGAQARGGCGPPHQAGRGLERGRVPGDVQDQGNHQISRRPPECPGRRGGGLPCHGDGLLRAQVHARADAGGDRPQHARDHSRRHHPGCRDAGVPRQGLCHPLLPA